MDGCQQRLGFLRPSEVTPSSKKALVQTVPPHRHSLLPQPNENAANIARGPTFSTTPPHSLTHSLPPPPRPSPRPLPHPRHLLHRPFPVSPPGIQHAPRPRRLQRSGVMPPLTDHEAVVGLAVVRRRRRGRPQRGRARGREAPPAGRGG